MKLYSSTWSPNGRKIESLIAYLGTEPTKIDIHQVNMMGGEQRTPEYLAINPNGKIPALVDGDFILWESNAILVYLASLRPDAGLLPGGLKERADVERWLFWQSSLFGPTVGKLSGERIFKKMFGRGEPDPVVIEQLEKELHVACAVLDQQLAGKEYVCGAPSVADFAIGPWSDSIEAFLGFSLAQYGNMRAWIGRLGSLRGWIQQPPLPGVS